MPRLRDAIRAQTRVLRPSWIDAALVAVLLGLLVIMVKPGHLGFRLVTLRFLLGLASVLPLLVRRPWPLAALLLSGGATFAAIALQAVLLPDAVGPLVALATVTMSGPRVRSALAGLLTIGGVIGAMAIAAQAGSKWVGRLGWEAMVAPAAVVAVAWVLGDDLRMRRRDLHRQQQDVRVAEQRREHDRTRAVEEERVRIARELHDVVAHHVSVIAVQSGAAHLLSEEGCQAIDALAAIEDTARQALADLRRLLGVLRRAGDDPDIAPQPSLEQIEELVADVQRAGLPIALTVEGDPVALPAGAAVSAYRIVQEALTNVLRHAKPNKVDVCIRYRRDVVELSVINHDARATVGTDAHTASGGHGLVGMRERAALYGGELQAGPLPSGGFRVFARLPLGDSQCPSAS